MPLDGSKNNILNVLSLGKLPSIALFAFAICGCGVSGEAYREMHLSAKTALPRAVEMESLFGSTVHFITHFGFTSEETNTWNTVVYFRGNGDKQAADHRNWIRL